MINYTIHNIADSKQKKATLIKFSTQQTDSEFWQALDELFFIVSLQHIFQSSSQHFAENFQLGASCEYVCYFRLVSRV